MKTRRKVLKSAGAFVGTLVVGRVFVSAAGGAEAPTRSEIISAIGCTLLPANGERGGYQLLEGHGINEEVSNKLRAIRDEDLLAFNSGAAAAVGEKDFVKQDEQKRAAYLKTIVSKNLADPKIAAVSERVYRAARVAVFTTYYQNFPEVITRDASGQPMTIAGDTHQILNPNTKKLWTGWDQAGFSGTWRWPEEEARRKELRRIAKTVAPGFQRFEA